MTTDTDEREAFEIAAKADGLDVGSWDDDDQMYDDASTQWAWQGWQARASAPARAPEVRALEVEPSAVEMARKDGVAATQTLREAMRQRRERDPSLAKHPDDIAVDSFAQAMREKLARKRALGYGGWDDKDRCSAQHLSDLLRSHVEKGDPVDVANFAMMLHQRGERIVPEPAPAQAEEIERLTKERDALKAGAPRLREALKKCADAADEFYRYQYGGEARGSYDGKPERRGIFDAGRQARAVLQSGGDGK